MDDIRFECRFYDDDAMVDEVIRKVTLGPNSKAIKWEMALAFALSALCAWTNSVKLAILSGGLGLFLAFYIICFPLIYRKLVQKEQLRLNSGTAPECVIQFGEQIVLTEGTLRIATDYAQIGEIRTLKHSCVLMTGKNTGIVFKPDSFTLGTCEDCLAFLKERCIHLGDPSAIYGYASSKGQRAARLMGMVMALILVGAAVAFLEDGTLSSLPPYAWIAAGIWLAASVFLLIAPKSVFKP